MHPVWALVGSALGAASANQLRRPIFAMAVPSGEPDRQLCATCGAGPMRRIPSSRGRCGNCQAHVGPRWAGIEISAALLVGLVAAIFGLSFETIGFGSVAALGIGLAVIDLHCYRLPDKLIRPALVILFLSLIAASASGAGWHRLERSLLSAVVLGLCYLLLAIIQPGQLGLGDVKLSVLIGMSLGWFGWRYVLLGGCMGFVLSGLTSLVLLALRRITLRSQIPFGPFMLVGAVVALLILGLVPTASGHRQPTESAITSETFQATPRN